MTNPFIDRTIFIVYRQSNVYIINLENISTNDYYLIATNAKFNETSLLWHRRLGHASTHQISK